MFGRPSYLVYDGENYFWNNQIPENSLVIGGNPECAHSIESICSLFDLKPPDLFGKNHKNSFLELGVDLCGVPASMIQRPSEFKKKLKQVTEWVSEVYPKLKDSSYLKTFQEESRLLRSMQEALFDTLAFNRWCLGKRMDKKVKNSFSVDKNGFLKRAIYNNVSTRTGRIVTTSGPQMLTSNKEIRGFLKSRYPKGRIIQLDFVSLEPRVALSYAGKNNQGDIYEMFNEEYFEGCLKRDQIKKLVLCALFGAGTRTLKKDLPENINPQSAVKSIRQAMNFFEVVSSKKLELEQKSEMKNIFGRDIVPSSDRDAVIFNNWLQSSAVDVALLGFSKIIKDMQSKNLKFNPIFIIHDALIIDADFETIQSLRDQQNISVFIENLGYFPIAAEYLDSK